MARELCQASSSIPNAEAAIGSLGNDGKRRTMSSSCLDGDDGDGFVNFSAFVQDYLCAKRAVYPFTGFEGVHGIARSAVYIKTIVSEPSISSWGIYTILHTSISQWVCKTSCRSTSFSLFLSYNAMPLPQNKNRTIKTAFQFHGSALKGPCVVFALSSMAYGAGIFGTFGFGLLGFATAARNCSRASLLPPLLVNLLNPDLSALKLPVPAAAGLVVYWLGWYCSSLVFALLIE